MDERLECELVREHALEFGCELASELVLENALGSELVMMDEVLTYVELKHEELTHEELVLIHVEMT